jgi:hypothetical protein
MSPDSLQFVKGGKGLSSHAAFPRPQKGVPGGQSFLSPMLQLTVRAEPTRNEGRYDDALNCVDA